MRNKLYIIHGKTYLSHINDKVHLYSLLHQLAFLAGRAKDEEDISHVLDTVKQYGEVAEEKFKKLGIPSCYLVFGKSKELKELMDRELDEVEIVPEEKPKPKKYLDAYIIPGSGFRLLVIDIHKLIAQYYSIARHLREAETEKDFLRLKKRIDYYERDMKEICRSLGLTEGSSAVCDVLEEAIIKRHNLIPLEDEDDELKDIIQGWDVEWSD